MMRRIGIVGAAQLLALLPLAGRADVETMREGRTEVVFPAGQAALARRVIERTERIRPRLVDRFRHDPGPVRIDLVSGHAALERIAGGPVPEWALAIALPGRGRVAVRLDQTDVLTNRLDDTLRHELAHLALAAVERAAGRRLPRWFNEGACEQFSGTLHLHPPGRTLALDAALGALLPLSRLEDAFPADPAAAERAYRQSLSVVEFMLATWPGSVERVLERFAAGVSFDAAVRDATGVSPADVERRWRRSVTPRHPWLTILLETVSVFALLAVVLVIGVFLYRRRARRTVARWAAEEAAAPPAESEEREAPAPWVGGEQPPPTSPP